MVNATRSLTEFKMGFAYDADLAGFSSFLPPFLRLSA